MCLIFYFLWSAVSFLFMKLCFKSFSSAFIWLWWWNLPDLWSLGFDVIIWFIRLLDKLLHCSLPISSFNWCWHCLGILFQFFLFLRQGVSVAFGSCPGTSSCRPCWPQTHKYLPASASLVLGPILTVAVWVFGNCSLSANEVSFSMLSCSVLTGPVSLCGDLGSGP